MLFLLRWGFVVVEFIAATQIRSYCCSTVQFVFLLIYFYAPKEKKKKKNGILRRRWMCPGTHTHTYKWRRSCVRRTRLGQMSFCTHKHSRLFFFCFCLGFCEAHCTVQATSLVVGSVGKERRRKKKYEKTCDKYIKHKHVGIHVHFQRNKTKIFYYFSA